jgi:hypothetical protein
MALAAGVGAALVSTGMAKQGFVYLNLDCGWSTGYRDQVSIARSDYNTNAIPR